MRCFHGPIPLLADTPPWPSGQSSGSAFSLSSTRGACRRVRSTGSCSTSLPSRVFGQLRLIAPSDWTPFLTNIFLHAGWLHLILNMWTLWIFGPAVEDRLGPVRFALFYLFCGLAAGLAHALANPDSVVPALGASGAIAGVIGCYARMFPAARLVVIVPILVIPLFFEISALAFAMIWFVMQLIPGLMSLGDTATGGVAWWAHICGFVSGWLASPILRRPAVTYRNYYRDEGI